jgi:hypothetical protein
MARRASSHKIALDCPLAPAIIANAYTRTFRGACVILGGVDALVKHLLVPEASVRAWLAGDETPPEPQFLAVLELVLLHVTARQKPS